MIKDKITLCGCGYGIPTHYHNDELHLHVLGTKECCREEIKDIFTFYKRDFHADGSLVNMVSGKTIGELTEYTFRWQRLYNLHKETGVWSRPKSKESTNSLTGDW
jgi:hypothetical protein